MHALELHATSEMPSVSVSLMLLRQWSTEATRALDDAQGPFDLVIACDCVFPPVYGESWKLLADSVRELLSRKSDTVVLLSFERRKGDQLDDFFAYCETNASPAVSCKRVLWDDPICIYRADLAPAGG